MTGVSIAHLIEQYGYLAVFVGTLLEGEMILILGGFAAHRGYLDLPGVMVVAFLGSLCGDQLFFWLGGHHGRWLQTRWPHWEPRFARVRRLVARYPRLILLGFRFVYGIRSITPLALGMSKIPFRQFLLYNLLGGAIWAIVVGLVGYFIGHALELFLGEIKRYEIIILAGLTLLCVAIWLVHRWRLRREEENGD